MRGEGLAPPRPDMQLQEHVIFDQVVRHARVNDAEIFAVDCELGVDFDAVTVRLYGGRKADRLRDFVETLVDEPRQYATGIHPAIDDREEPR